MKRPYQFRAKCFEKDLASCLEVMVEIGSSNDNAFPTRLEGSD